MFVSGADLWQLGSTNAIERQGSSEGTCRGESRQSDGACFLSHSPHSVVANLIWKSQTGGGVPSIAAARTCCNAAGGRGTARN